MNEKVFKLSKPVTVGGDTFTEVTMRSFKGSAIATFISRREELAKGGNEKATFMLCEIASGAPAQLFEDMELDDYLPILEFMTPHFQKMQAAMGNVAAAKGSKSQASSN